MKIQLTEEQADEILSIVEISKFTINNIKKIWKKQGYIKQEVKNCPICNSGYTDFENPENKIVYGCSNEWNNKRG